MSYDDDDDDVMVLVRGSDAWGWKGNHGPGEK